MIEALILLSLGATPAEEAETACRYEAAQATMSGTTLSRLLKEPPPAKVRLQNLALRTRSDRSTTIGQPVVFTHAPFNLGPEALDFGQATVVMTSPPGLTVSGVETALFWDCVTAGRKVTCASTSSARPGPLPEITVRLVATKVGKHLLCSRIGWVGAKETDPRDNGSCVSVTARPG